MPTPKFSTRVNVKPEHADKVTTEIVDAVQGNKVSIRGMLAPTATNLIGVAVGDSVRVMWQGGTPTFVLDSQERRGHVFDAPGAPARGIVEQLILGSAGGGPRDVFFRNDSVLSSLGVRALTGQNYTDVLWGMQDNLFACRRAGFTPIIYDIFKINRAPKKLSPFGVKPKVTLVRTDTLSNGAITFGTFTVRASTQVVKNTVTFINGIGLPGPGGSSFNSFQLNHLSSYLNNKGDLCAVWSWRFTLRGVATALFPPPSTINIEPIGFSYIFVVNHTKGTILFNQYTNSSLIDGAFGFTPAHISTFDPDNVAIVASGTNASSVTVKYFPSYIVQGLRMSGDAVDTLFVQAIYQQGHFLGSFTGSPDKKTGVAFIHPSNKFQKNTVFALATNLLASGGFGIYRASPSEASRDTLLTDRHAIIRAQGGDSTPFTFGTRPVLVSFDTGELKQVDTSASHLDDVSLVMMAPDVIYTLGADHGDSDRFFVKGWNTKNGKPSTLTLDTTKPLVKDGTLSSHKKLVGVLDDSAHTITKGDLTVLFDFLLTSFHVVPDGVPGLH